MPIVGVPGWIGSSAVSVTGQRWMSAARTAVQLSAAGNMSQLAGRSKEI
ncbi:receptor-recognizing protein, partial [Salmonella enterica]|nr:receptor-recognizing protein [Salmonella enterica]